MQVQLDEQLAELGTQLRALPELATAVARVGAKTTAIFHEVAPPSDLDLDLDLDLETESEDAESENPDEAQPSEPFPLAKQAGVLRDALFGVLPGAAEDESEEDEPEGGDAPVLISCLAQGVASLERTVYSTALLCQVTGALLRPAAPCCALLRPAAPTR